MLSPKKNNYVLVSITVFNSKTILDYTTTLLDFSKLLTSNSTFPPFNLQEACKLVRGEGEVFKYI
jgi:hypothetical protein